MNKYLYILGLVGTALLSACSTSDDLSRGDSSSVDKTKESVLIYEAGQNSEVPITLGVGQSRGYTRAPIGDESENPTYSSFSTEAGKYLGVFCLATDYQTPYKTNHPIDNNWKEDGTGLSAWMKNVPATTSNVDGKVAFLNHDRTGEQSYYYPLGNWMKYNFYTYYPWQNEDDDTRTLVINKSQISEKFYTFDGSQDIIWGIANPPVADAFSAKYFIENSSAEIPQFSFKHKLAQFRFFVKAADGDASTLAGLSAQVTDMYIANAIYRLQLIVADKNNSGNNGELYWYGTTFDKALKKMSIKRIGSDKDRFVDDDSDGEVDNPLVIYTDDIAVVMAADPVGYIMLADPTVRQRYIQHPEYPDPAPDFKYQLVLKLSYTKDTEDKEKTITIDLDPSDVGLETFEAGKAYNIVINIKSSDLD